MYRTIIFLMAILVSADAFSRMDVGKKISGSLGRTLEGQRISAKQHRGKVLIVSFWSTACKRCMKELPVLNGIQQQAGLDKVQVVGINYKQTKKHVEVIEHAMPDSDIIFTYDRGAKIIEKYNVNRVPFLVIIGADGKVVAKHINYNMKKLPKLVKEINKAISDSLIAKQGDTSKGK